MSRESTKTTTKWHAIVTRDTSSKVLYGVRTTGIYCRASCPARLARRANVVFYDSPTQAETDGFRAYKRCSPNQDSTVETLSQLRAVKAGCDSIAEAVRSGRTVKLSELAAAAKLTPCYYHRMFKKVTGVTPGQYAGVCKSGGDGVTVSDTGRELDCGDGFMDEFVDWEGEAFDSAVALGSLHGKTTGAYRKQDRADDADDAGFIAQRILDYPVTIS